MKRKHPEGSAEPAEETESRTTGPFPYYVELPLRVLRAAYPDGVPPEEYLPLLSVLLDSGWGGRGAGSVMEAYDGKSYALHYYQALHVIPNEEVAPSLKRRVLEKLQACGWAACLQEVAAREESDHLAYLRGRRLTSG